LPWLAHTVDAYGHYSEHNGNYLAAALTFFSFLALFPLILLAVSVAGFVLARDQSLLHRLINSITSHVSGSLGKTLRTAINTAIKDRAGIGVVGLVGVLLSGLGWISSLRTAIDVVWGLPKAKRNFLVAKLADAAVLAGLGLAVVISLGLTAGGTAATGSVLRILHAQHLSGVSALTRVLGLVVAVAGDTLIFGWLIIRLPDRVTPRSVSVKTALLASVGFEALKVIGTYYIAKVSTSPTASIFGSVVGVLLWIYLVSRFLLYCVAWAATSPVLAPVATAVQKETPQPEPVAANEYTLFGKPVSGPVLSLFAAGAVFGAGASAALRRQPSPR
jgi:membrane protein